ncbi:MAG: hypothetical protein EA411_05880 [Saprospirales bacterium]|nr:MAG: hypothetical protein EA411_05880 [Saprospirales bacterium]
MTGLSCHTSGKYFPIRKGTNIMLFPQTNLLLIVLFINESTPNYGVLMDNGQLTMDNGVVLARIQGPGKGNDFWEIRSLGYWFLATQRS